MLVQSATAGPVARDQLITCEGFVFFLFVYAFYSNEVFIVGYLSKKKKRKQFLMVKYCEKFTLLMFCNNMCVLPASKLH